MKRIILLLLINASLLYSQQFTDTTLNNLTDGKALWGDVNDDGYLDVFSFGRTAFPQSEFYIYDPQQNQFIGPSANYTISEGISNGNAAFGDFNNDNRLDLFITGYNGSSYVSELYYNTGYGFAEYDSNSLFSTYSLSFAVFWADFNNDGNQDLFVGSTNGIDIYQNIGRGNSFYKHSLLSEGISNACFAVADIDNDGLIDIFVSGYQASRVTYFFKNLNNFSFEQKPGNTCGISKPVDNGAVAFGDLDQDGDLDFILTGRTLPNPDQFDILIYKQNAPFDFTKSEDSTDLHSAAISLIDADGDGDLDMAYSGMVTGNVHVAAVDTNDGSGNFNNWIPTSSFASVSGGSIEWGDYNQDRKPDLLISGTGGQTGYTTVYKNIAGQANNIPSRPTNLMATTNGNTVSFNWTASQDDKSNSLTYNLYIDSNYQSLLVSPMMTVSNGYNRFLTPRPGNVGQVLHWTIYNVPAGQYKAYVCAVDNSFNISNESDPFDFIVTYNGVPTCSTREATSITDTSAILSGDVYFAGDDSTETNVYFLLSSDGGAFWETLAYSGNPVKATRTCTYQKIGLSPNTNYDYKIRVENEHGVNEGGNIMFSTLPVAPSFGTPIISGNTTIGNSNDLVITIPINNYLAGDQVKIEYGKYFGSPIHEADMFSSGQNWEYILSADNVSENGLWFIIKVDRTSMGAGKYYYPSKDQPYLVSFTLTQDKLNEIKTNKGAYPSGLAQNSWNTYSLPFSAEAGQFIDLPGLFGNQELKDGLPTNWDAWEFNGTGIGRTTKIYSNKAYFIYHTKNENICPDDNLSFWGITPKTSDFNLYTLTVDTGWQLIPWPYLLTAQATRKSSSRCGRLWILNQGEWIDAFDSRFSGTMRPHGAYAFYSRVSGWTLDSLFHFQPLTTYKPIQKQYTSGEWEIKLRAFDGKKFDRCNYFGAAVHSTTALDDNDEYEPIAMGDAVRAYFRAKKDERTIKLSADYQSADQEQYSWDMIVENPGNRYSVELTWDKMNVPAGLEIILVDLNNNELVDLNAIGRYEFKARALNPFKIYAGDASYVNKEIEKLELPDKFTLYANYPNPFNPGTTIKYDLKLSSAVTLSVYNALGQLVRTLVNGKVQTTGSYSVYWDGKDAIGRQVASGIYICRIDAKDINGKTFTKSNKMVLLK